MDRREFLASSAALALASCNPARGVTGHGRGPLRLLILGGTNYVGPALVRSAMARGHLVTLFNRGVTRPHLFSELQRLRGDRFPERGAGLDALKTGTWDVVFDVPAYYPRLVGATARLLVPRVQRYIMVSSIAAYADWSIMGMTEASPVRQPPVLGSYQEAGILEAGGRLYGARKVACEQAIAEPYGSRWASVRATGIIGAGIEDDDPNKFFWPARLAQGRPILAPGDGMQKLQSIDVRDLADFLVHIAESDQMGVFNAVGPEKPFTTGEYVDVARRVSGGTAPVIWSGRDLGEMPMYNATPAFAAFEPAKARAAGLRYRSLEASVRANWEWFRTNYPVDFDFAAAGYGLSAAAEADGLQRAHREGRWGRATTPYVGTANAGGL